MKKLPCLFERDFSNPRRPVILPTVTAGCEWVLAGEGIATRKWDGTACLARDGRLFKRYDAKQGKQPPAGFEPAQDPDSVTGHWPGWVPVSLTNPDSADVWIAIAALNTKAWLFMEQPRTFEAIGPRINSNNERVDVHQLIAHGSHLLVDVPRTFEGLREYLRTADLEGIVFWRQQNNPDCEMVKIRRDDFGFAWPPK